MKNKISGCFRNSKQAKIAVILFFISAILAASVFLANYAVIFDYRLNFYNIKTTDKIYISSSSSIEDTLKISPQLKRLKNLNSLSLKTGPEDDLSFLKDFEALEALSLSTGLDDPDCTLDTLPAIPQLKSLSLVWYDKLGLDCTPISQLTSLESLLIGSSNVSDWSFAESLPNFRSIYINDIYGEPEKINWTSMQNVKSIESFTAYNISYDQTLLDVLEDMPLLSTVDISFGGDLTDEDRTYIYDWIEHMEKNSVEIKISGFNYDLD